MNSNTLFLILGYCLVSICLFKANAQDTRVPSHIGPKGLDSGAGSVPSVRGAVKPGAVPSAPVVAGVDALKAGDSEYGFSKESIDAIVDIGKIPDVAEYVPVGGPEEKADETAESAKKEAEAQAKKAGEEAIKADAAQKITETKFPLAVGALPKVDEARKAAEEASKKAIEAATLEEATKYAEETDKALKDAIEKAKAVDEPAKEVENKSAEADTASTAATAAAKIAKEKSEAAEKLDTEPGKPNAVAAKKAADEADKSAKAAVASSTKASQNAVKAKEAKTESDKYIKESEAHKAAADKAVEDLTDDPNKVKPAQLNFVVDEKYDYFDQLLLADRCDDAVTVSTGCKAFSNCYLDHTKPICVCFPGYISDDAAVTACVKQPDAVCEDKKTCHRNATCVKDETKGLGCQCKAKFAGDGLLCSSAFSYFMNFFLVLAIVSVQLYM